jgi:hypothetical protein
MAELQNGFKASLIANDLLSYLAKVAGQAAEVHAVYPHAVNLLHGEELISLTSQDDISPMGI